MWGRRAWRVFFTIAVFGWTAVAMQMGLAWYWIAAGAGFVLVLWVLMELGSPPAASVRLFRALGVEDARDFKVHVRDLPAYRYPDVFRACRAWAERESAHALDLHCTPHLGTLLSGQLSPHEIAQDRSAPRRRFEVGPDQHEQLPLERFWVSPRRDCVRLRLHQERCQLEVAAPDSGRGGEILDWIVARTTSDSIFRGSVVLAGADLSVMRYDEYAVPTVGGALSLSFGRLEEVSPDDIVLDEEVRRILHRNVVDLQNDGERLWSHGVPLSRGVLLYGPPGTGKTYACRYLFGQLHDSTVLVAAGNALMRVREIFELARELAPSLVVLEDVDLVFSSREHNLQAGTLGTLMDELDGLRPRDHVGVILTTNAVERVEAAIKDRPGRISQAVFFGAPGPELRDRYLRRYLRDRSLDHVDMERIVQMSSGTTHAFLREWVHRALQLSVERVTKDEPRLDTSCFEDAMHEMRTFAEGAERVIGFAIADAR